MVGGTDNLSINKDGLVWFDRGQDGPVLPSMHSDGTTLILPYRPQAMGGAFRDLANFREFLYA